MVICTKHFWKASEGPLYGKVRASQLCKADICREIGFYCTITWIVHIVYDPWNCTVEPQDPNIEYGTT